MVEVPAALAHWHYCGWQPDENSHRGAEPATGELVEVKSAEEIRATLDANGKNRGLIFGTTYTPYCGKRYRVRSHLDQMIIEKTGQMRELTNTVVLDDIVCMCPGVVGGCPRQDSIYWREIWLRRVEPVGPSATRN